MGKTTQAERDAVRNSGDANTAAQFDKESPEQQDQETLTLEQIAFAYVNQGGKDPRALAVVQAATDAGRKYEDSTDQEIGDLISELESTDD